MAMNNVDKLLSETCDFLEQHIADDIELRQDLATLFAADQHPEVVRVLSQFTNTTCTIVLGEAKY